MVLAGCAKKVMPRATLMLLLRRGRRLLLFSCEIAAQPALVVAGCLTPGCFPGRYGGGTGGSLK